MNQNIIDYDVIDYIDFKQYKKDDKLYVTVTAEVRVVSFDNNKIKSKIIKDLNAPNLLKQLKNNKKQKQQKKR